MIRTKIIFFYIPVSEKYKWHSSILVEGDASSESYFITGNVITGKTVTAHECGSERVWGDILLNMLMGEMEATVTWNPDNIAVTRNSFVELKSVNTNCGNVPDADMILTVVILFEEGSTIFWNLFSWRLKEIDITTFIFLLYCHHYE